MLRCTRFWYVHGMTMKFIPGAHHVQAPTSTRSCYVYAQYYKYQIHLPIGIISLKAMDAHRHNVFADGRHIISRSSDIMPHNFETNENE